MKAYVLHSVNDLRYEDVKKPELREGWALIRVKVSGICSSDIPRIFTSGTYHFPTIPGHEFSGIVEAVCSEKDKGYIGKRVGIFPLIPCKECEYCKAKNYEMCNDYDYVGSRRDGGFAELVAVPVWNLIELPDSVSFVQAATLEPFAVAYHAVKRAYVKSTDTVAIVGTGMIGFAAAQWASVLGAKKVVVIGRTLRKKKYTDCFDNIHYIALNETSELKEYDKVIEAVGSNEALNTSIQITKPGGIVVLMGNPSGEMKLHKDIYWRILRKQITLTGAWNSSYENNGASEWSEVCKAMASRSIEVDSLISHHFKQDELIDALLVMKEHKEVYTKIIVEWN